MRLYVSFVLAGLLLMVPLPLEAHHSQRSFWLTDQSASIEGVLKEVHIINPHVQIVVEVTGPNGEKSDWYVTGAKNASAMIRAGWTDDTLTPGMRPNDTGHAGQRGRSSLASERRQGPPSRRRHDPVDGKGPRL